MNLRQKKKKYKKKHGYNPLKDRDGNMILKESDLYKADLSAEDLAKIIKQIKPLMINMEEVAKKLAKAAFESIGRMAHQIGDGFQAAADRIGTETNEFETNIVTVTRALAERRKNG